MISKKLQFSLLLLMVCLNMSCQQNRTKCQTIGHPGIGLIVYDLATSKNISCQVKAKFVKGIKELEGIGYWYCDKDTLFGGVGPGIYSISINLNDYAEKVIEDIHVNKNHDKCLHVITTYTVVKLEPLSLSNN